MPSTLAEAAGEGGSNVGGTGNNPCPNPFYSYGSGDLCPIGAFPSPPPRGEMNLNGGNRRDPEAPEAPRSERDLTLVGGRRETNLEKP